MPKPFSLSISVTKSSVQKREETSRNNENRHIQEQVTLACPPDPHPQSCRSFDLPREHNKLQQGTASLHSLIFFFFFVRLISLIFFQILSRFENFTK